MKSLLSSSRNTRKSTILSAGGRCWKKNRADPTKLQLTKSGKTLSILVLILMLFGLVMLSSAGIVEGQKRFDSPYYYLTHQLLYGVLPGLAVFVLFSKINYKFWRGAALPFLILVTGLLVAVFIPGIGQELKGAQRWIDLKLFTFQPSEFLKLAIVIYLAAWFGARDGRTHGTSAYQLAPFFLILAFVSLLLIMQPDMGTLGLVTLIAVAIYFFAGYKLSHFLGLILVLAVLLGAFALAEPYRFNRIKAFLNPDIDKQDTSYHINQSLLGIGSGGLFGLGFGQSRQKFNFLPEPVGDSIFAVTVEELGFVGGVFLLALFLIFSVVMVNIARGAPNQFTRLTVLGMLVWVVGQAIVNISAISGLIPLTGVPLPFISFGSSSLVAILAGLGIVVNISRY